MPTYLTVLYIYFYSAHVYMHIYNHVITLQSFEISRLLAVVIFLLNLVVWVVRGYLLPETYL